MSKRTLMFWCLFVKLHVYIYNYGSGDITGWGYTKESSGFSNELKDIEISYIPRTKCFEKVPSSFKKFISYDKMCGEYKTTETSVCGGDTGGGLVFYNLLDERYYIKGIVSVTSTTDENLCDLNEFSIYTSVAAYKDYLQNVTANHLLN